MLYVSVSDYFSIKRIFHEHVFRNNFKELQQGVFIVVKLEMK